jgi:hypothetical protein
LEDDVSVLLLSDDILIVVASDDEEENVSCPGVVKGIVIAGSFCVVIVVVDGVPAVKITGVVVSVVIVLVVVVVVVVVDVAGDVVDFGVVYEMKYCCYSY